MRVWCQRSSPWILSVVFLLAVIMGGPTGDGQQLPTANAQGSNPITVENAQPGSSGWRFDADASQTPLKATNHEIEGYASLTSVNKGGQIQFKVSLSSNAQYTMQIYRMGYYPTGTKPDGTPCDGPCGGRLMQQVGPLNGFRQAACPTSNAAATLNLIECSWTTSHTLTVPTTWTTGNYVVKLRRLDNNLQNYMTFVVRDDGTPADFVLSMDVTTWQAYNFWGGAGNGNIGHSLYGTFNDVTFEDFPDRGRAHVVSFDRPYINNGESDGAGYFFVWDYPMVRWLEKEGYNVTYATNVDMETNPNLLNGRKAFLNTGHDEYYSANMRANLQHYINQGAHMGFFSANNWYFRINWDNSATGQPHRRVICRKDITIDPVTIRWRDLSPPQPENAIGGVALRGLADSRHFRVSDASHWIYAGTGLVNYVSGTPITSGPGQNAIPGIIGYEFDADTSDATLAPFASSNPAGIQRVAHSAVPATDNGTAAFADTVVYTAASGAIVFSAGTMQWSWGLDNSVNTGFCDCNQGLANSKSQQITKNILNRFLTTVPTPLTPTPTVTPGGPTLTPTNTPGGLPPTNTPTGPTPTPLPAGQYLLSTFDAGLGAFAKDGPGGATVQGTTVNSGAGAVALTNATGQYVALQADLQGGPQAQTYTRFCFRVAAGLSGTTVLAQGRDPSGNPMWEVDYDAPRNSLDVYFWNGARARQDVYPAANLVAADTWYCAEVRVSAATAGRGEVWLNGTSVGAVDADLSASQPYSRLMLMNTAVGTIHLDDVRVANTLGGPVGAGAAPPALPTATPTNTLTPTSLPATPTNTPTPTPVAATPTPTSTPLPAGVYLVGNFDSGLGSWTAQGSGSATVQTGTVNSGAGAVALTNATGQYVALQADLQGGPQAQTYSRFCFRLAAGLSGTTVLAQGRYPNGNPMWEVDYDAPRNSLDVYFWNGARARQDVYPAANLVAANTWYCAEIHVNAAAAGRGEVWLNGTSVGAVNADLSASQPYRRLILMNTAVGTIHLDDVRVANTLGGPVGAAGP